MINKIYYHWAEIKLSNIMQCFSWYLHWVLKISLFIYLLHNHLINIYSVANSVADAGAMKTDGCWSFLSKSSQTYLVDLYVKKLNILQSDMFYNKRRDRSIHTGLHNFQWGECPQAAAPRGLLVCSPCLGRWELSPSQFREASVGGLCPSAQDSVAKASSSGVSPCFPDRALPCFLLWFSAQSLELLSIVPPFSRWGKLRLWQLRSYGAGLLSPDLRFRSPHTVMVSAQCRLSMETLNSANLQHQEQTSPATE